MESGSHRLGKKVMETSKKLHFLSGINALYKQMVNVQHWPGLCTK